MIEPTPEMVDAFEDAAGECAGIGVWNGLTAALAIVERDYRVVQLCGDELAPGLRCRFALGHNLDEYAHEAKTPTGARVTWS